MFEGRTSLYEFAPDGTFVREIGGNLFRKAWAHAVRVDADDNIWLVDNGSSMAVKLSPSGRVLQVFGRRPESSHARYPRYQGPKRPPHSLRPPPSALRTTRPPTPGRRRLEMVEKLRSRRVCSEAGVPEVGRLP